MKPLLDRSFLQLALLWLLVVIVSLAVRPLLPVDETRYLSVAWEMWLRDDFLVPFKNGEPYAHKPPLLFWLIQAGWAVFGVNEWWPRLIAPLLALLCIPLVRLLALRLWPDRIEVGKHASWLLFASGFWLAFATLVQFDLLLVLATLLAMLGWWQMAQTRRFSVLPGLAIGIGILAKGPVILLHVLPVALLAPLWLKPGLCRWCWYGQVLLSLLLGAAIGLAWAIPAGIAGGEAYRQAIFWGQTAGRVTESFAHAEPWWWYLPMLPLLLLPWVAWPGVWRSVRAGFRRESPEQFLLLWLLPVLVGFSLVSGKQLKYLLPLLPAMVLLVAVGLSRVTFAPTRAWLAGLICFLSGVLLFSLHWWLPEDAAPWLAEIESYWGAGLCLAGLVFLIPGPAALSVQLKRLAIATALVVLGVQLALMQHSASRYDLTPISQRIARLQQADQPVANVGEYHAQYNFLGRLLTPLVELNVPAPGVVDWAKAHSDAYLVVYRSAWPNLGQGALYEQHYRGREHELGLWRAHDFLQALPKKKRKPRVKRKQQKAKQNK